MPPSPEDGSGAVVSKVLEAGVRLFLGRGVTFAEKWVEVSKRLVVGIGGGCTAVSSG